MLKSKKIAFVASITTSLAVSALAHAAAFTAGNLLVTQFGANDASTPLTANATQSYIKELTLSGTVVQTLETGLRNSGLSTSEGFLAYNSGTISLGGYTQAAGTTGITSVSSGRAVQVYTLAGTGTITTLNETATLGNIRSAVSTGTGIYAATSSGGVRYITPGSTDPSIQVSATPINARVVKINNNQLYLSTASGAFMGVNTVGNGIPTTSEQTTTLIASNTAASARSSYDYYFADATTLYVADDSTAIGNAAGIQRFNLVAGVWTYAYNLTTTATRGLTGVTASGVTTLFATTTAASANTLLSIVDIGATSVPTTLATAPANTAFRGVTFLPINVPIPGVAGDYNRDGYVDAADYTVWADSFGQTGPGLPADGNSDNVVDAADYTIWADNFGQGVPPVGVSGAVPEPTALAFATPALALLGRRRRA